MKKKLLVFIGIFALVCSVVLFAACSDGKTSQTALNNAAASKSEAQAVTLKSISSEDAVEAALNHAAVKRENANFTKIKLDPDAQTPEYEIEFIADGKKYEYEISADSGKILKSEAEAIVDNSVTESSSAVDTVPSKNPEKSGYIGVDAAMQKAMDAAFKHAGIKAEDSVVNKADFDGDDIIPHYDIELISGDYEYDYEIDAKTGAVIDFEKEKIKKSSVPTSEECISSQAAIEAALKHAGIKAEDAKAVKAELEKDDIISHYDVEFKVGLYEYSYEINAKTGAVIASEKELD